VKVNFLLLTAAAFYGVAGVALLFAPEEILTALGEAATPFVAWLMQAFGAALLGFAWLNWFHRYTLTGGILGRPVLMPNLAFASISFWLALGAWRRAGGSLPLGSVAAGFGLLSVAFGARLFARTTAKRGS
jgi:hypothetical protein